jgi:RNA polymerase sigma-70 factor (ECF subfamily)
VLLLREVLGFSAREVAETLDTTVASVNSALQRARSTVRNRLPERSQQSTLRALGDKRIRELVDAYVEAWGRGDVDALRELLAEDAVFSMPPWAAWWRGREAIASVARAAVETCLQETRIIPTRANGQPALAYYHFDDASGRFRATALDVFTLEGSQIKEISGFVMPGLFPHFGLLAELAPEPGRRN